MPSTPVHTLATQITTHIFMVRPAHFGYNEETAESNAFMQQDPSKQPAEIQRLAQQEFDAFVARLRTVGIKVTVFEDQPAVFTPDAVFPNNWISIHQQKKIILYPIMAPTRRRERRKDIVAHFLAELKGYTVIDLSESETSGQFLEGTGSMVMDRAHQIVYACISPRTDPTLLQRFCAEVACEAVIFDAVDEQGQAIYHTNVMMALGVDFAVVCLESVPDTAQREALVASLVQTGHEIVPITYAQMNQFAGNMLQVCNEAGERFLVMSARAHASLSPEQLARLQQFNHQLILGPLDVIETYGGGSVRCMMAEVFH